MLDLQKGISENISLILMDTSSKLSLLMRKLSSLFLLLCIVGCGAVKKKTTFSENKERTITVKASEEKTDASKQATTERTKLNKRELKKLSKADDVINTALTFSGTRYKFGGTTKKGMDCSGLLYVSFGEHDVQLPRVSYQMAQKGKKVKIKNVKKGDLLFFKTSKRGKKINHVGMVVSIKNNEIKFIHASSSRGVTVSSLREGFWNSAFVKATRVL